MSTNHNRIRVSDLETDERDKILATNSKGELEFIATKNIKVDSYNALDYDQEGKALDARQGKILKDLVNNKTDKGGFQGTAQDLANSIPDLNSANLKLGSYTSTRNDGQLYTNKVLSTDASGNLKLYSLPISTYPAPYLTEIPNNNYLPNTTGNIVLKGSFFTPNMTVLIQGQTVNYITFISDNEIYVNITIGSEEGLFGVTLNNGLSVTFADALLIVLGTVYIPTISDWTNVANPISFETGEVLTQTGYSQGSALLNFTLDKTKNYSLYYKMEISPLIIPSSIGRGTYQNAVFLRDQVTGDVYSFFIWWFDIDSVNLMCRKNNAEITAFGGGSFSNFNLRFHFNNGKMYLYMSGILLYSFGDNEFQNSLEATFSVGLFDYKKIKYVVHP